jgi:hypothetical protein
MSSPQQSFEERLSAIEARNARVEANKAWEVSWTRRLSIAALTYLVIVNYLIATDNDRPFTNAAVPLVGFLLSTLVLGKVRAIWEKKRVK